MNKNGHGSFKWPPLSADENDPNVIVGKKLILKDDDNNPRVVMGTDDDGDTTIAFAGPNKYLAAAAVVQEGGVKVIIQRKELGPLAVLGVTDEGYHLDFVDEHGKAQGQVMVRPVEEFVAMELRLPDKKGPVATLAVGPLGFEFSYWDSKGKHLFKIPDDLPGYRADSSDA